MEPSIGKQLGLAIIAWTLYFLVVFFLCNFIYRRLRGQPPKDPKMKVILQGRPVSALTVWEEKDRGLRRLFFAIGVALMFLPLLLPLVLKRLL